MSDSESRSYSTESGEEMAEKKKPEEKPTDEKPTDEKKKEEKPQTVVVDVSDEPEKLSKRKSAFDKFKRKKTKKHLSPEEKAEQAAIKEAVKLEAAEDEVNTIITAHDVDSSTEILLYGGTWYSSGLPRVQYSFGNKYEL